MPIVKSIMIKNMRNIRHFFEIGVSWEYIQSFYGGREGAAYGCFSAVPSKPVGGFGGKARMEKLMPAAPM